MQRWGLTIDLVSCIGLELAIGLCVDYAAHIGHTFMTVEHGTKSERALETVLQIGSAVLYGGLSTLLALSMLADSEAYTFNAFFKVRRSKNEMRIVIYLKRIYILFYFLLQIFLLVIVFGLFFGLVFLPVILSLLGPKPHAHADANDDDENCNRSKTNNGISSRDNENGTEMIKFIDYKPATEDAENGGGKLLEK